MPSPLPGLAGLVDPLEKGHFMNRPGPNDAK